MSIADIMNSVAQSASTDPAPASDQPAEGTELEPGQEVPDREEKHEAASDEDDDPGSDESDDDSDDGAEATYEVTVQGEKMQVSLEELRQGYMKGKDYTQKSMELSKERKQVESAAERMQADRDEIVGFFAALKDPGKILPTLRGVNQEIRRAVDEAVWHAAGELVQEMSLPEEERNRRAYARQQAELEEDRKRIASEREAMEEQEQQELWARRFEAWTPRALEAAGLPDTDRVKRIFTQEVMPIIERRGATEADFQEAAKTVAEEWPELIVKEDAKTDEKESKKTAAKHPPAAPKRSSGARRRPAEPQRKKQSRIRSSDFFADLMTGKF